MQIALRTHSVPIVALVTALALVLSEDSVVASDSDLRSELHASIAPQRAEDPAHTPSALADLWSVALRLEADEELEASAEVLERIAALSPKNPEAHWRLSRTTWRIADALPADALDDRVALLERAAEQAQRGLDLGGECGDCALWRYAALGRLSTLKGFMWGARHAREMRRLLDDGIAMRPAGRDDIYNSTLGHLYYASAIFYRMVPEWFWLPLVIGVKGDTAKALEHIHAAMEITEPRVDYQVELGVILLCRGNRKNSRKDTQAGIGELQEALGMEPRVEDDLREQSYAAHLIEFPDKGCGYAGDGFIDVEGVDKSKLRAGG